MESNEGTEKLEELGGGVNEKDKRISDLHLKVILMGSNRDRQIEYYDVHEITKYIMRELNKIKFGWYGFRVGLSGIDKRIITTMIISHILLEFGVPGIANAYTAEVIVKVIETIYLTGYHKIKSTKKKLLDSI